MHRTATVIVSQREPRTRQTVQHPISVSAVSGHSPDGQSENRQPLLDAKEGNRLTTFCQSKRAQLEAISVNHSDGDSGCSAACNLLANPLSHRSKIVLLTVSSG